MMDALQLILTDLWHLGQTLTLFVVVGCLTAPIVYGWYCVDAKKAEEEEE